MDGAVKVGGKGSRVKCMVVDAKGAPVGTLKGVVEGMSVAGILVRETDGDGAPMAGAKHLYLVKPAHIVKFYAADDKG